MSLIKMVSRRPLLVGALIVLAPLVTAFAPDSADHADPVVRVLLALVLILAVAKLGSEVMERIGLPAVLGELLGGVLLGNMVLLNARWDFFEAARVTPISADWAIILAGLAQLGVIILLFEVGLESTVQGMLKVGGSAFVVAVLGVIVPFVLGFGVSWYFIREIPAGLAAMVAPGFSLHYVHMFVGAVLCATSVGITARVFKDLNRLQQKEAQIVLGAAVIDDVLGLIILAVVSGIISSAEAGQPMALGSILRITLIAFVFLVGSLTLGVVLVPRIMNVLSKMRTRGIMLISAIIFAFGLSYLSSLVGLAPIVGAFAAGLLLDEVHFKGFRDEYGIEHLIRPISALLVPIFFVLMGVQVRLETFADLSVLGIAAGLTLAALIGKQICGLGVLEKGLDRLTIGVGMIPRGEVGLIFANIGKNLRVIDDSTFSAAVIMVIVTTLITPPILKWTLSRKRVARRES